MFVFMSADAIPEEELTTLLIGLLVTCPVDGGNPEDCCLNDLRKRPMRERYGWVKALTLEEKRAAWRRHLECAEQKANRK